MGLQYNMSLKLAMEELWYKECWNFLRAPVLATVVCYCIPLFRCEQGMNHSSILLLSMCFSFVLTLAPRRQYYESRWKKIMEYHEFVLACAKRTLLFAVPSGIISRIATYFMQGYPKELAMFFETAIWGLAAGIFTYVLVAYADEAKMSKGKGDSYKVILSNLWKWIIPSTVAFLLLMMTKTYILMELLKGRK